MPDATFLHCDNNPGFDGQAPEPIHKNLLEFSEDHSNGRILIQVWLLMEMQIELDCTTVLGNLLILIILYLF